MISTQLVRQGACTRRCIQSRFFRADPLKEPSKFIEGLNAEDVEKDEDIATFLKVNFPTNEEGVYERPTLKAIEKRGDPPNVDYPLNIRKIHGFVRDSVREEGSRRCVTLREKGQVPGVIYGQDPTQNIRYDDPNIKIYVKTPWPVLQREIDLHHWSFASRVYDLTLYEDESDTEGTVHRVLPTDVDRHPIKNQLFCCNYLRYHPGRAIKIPILYVNEEESPSMKRGGFIAPVNRVLKCFVEDGVRIPDHVELDCTGLKLKQVVRGNRLILPEGVRMCKKIDPNQFLIGTVFGPRAGEEAADAEKEKDDKEKAREKAKEKK